MKLRTRRARELPSLLLPRKGLFLFCVLLHWLVLPLQRVIPRSHKYKEKSTLPLVSSASNERAAAGGDAAPPASSECHACASCADAGSCSSAGAKELEGTQCRSFAATLSQPTDSVACAHMVTSPSILEVIAALKWSHLKQGGDGAHTHELCTKAHFVSFIFFFSTLPLDYVDTAVSVRGCFSSSPTRLVNRTSRFNHSQFLSMQLQICVSPDALFQQKP